MIDPRKVADFMIFRDVDAGDVEAILASGQPLRYEAGVVVLEEDESGPDSDLFIILDGRAEVLIESKRAQKRGAARHRQITTLDQGEVFGELGLLRGKRRSARVKAYTALDVLKINRERLFDQLDKNPRLGYLFMRNLASTLSDRLIDLNFMLRNET